MGKNSSLWVKFVLLTTNIFWLYDFEKFTTLQIGHNTLGTLGTHFSYSRKWKDEKKRYSTGVGNMENEKPFTRRKTIVISKIVFQY